ncbi:MAG: S1 RNA-binding domain-containing protein [Thermodesulfobacteriota bacterium]|nr:S1 RNA-binding domain-containing protein [Thermodesulfobacteriota bacterium]
MNDDETRENFADLFEAYSAKEVQVGDKITGEIIAIGDESIIVDTGTKVDGIVERNELLDENNELPYREGDTIELYVVTRKMGELRLSRAISGIGGLHLLEEAYENALPIEGRVEAICKGGFQVKAGGRRAFCPVSQMDTAYVQDIETHVGKDYRFLITQFEEEGKNIVVSRRALLEKERASAHEEFLQGLNEGDILDGKVIRLVPFGAFVELIPGLEGLVHISEISYSRLDDPAEGVQIGEQVRIKVITMGKDPRTGRPKIALSIKQVQGNPWEEVDTRFQVGDKVGGKVTRCMAFGVFVEIAEGIEGLVHISEMSYTTRIVNPEDHVKPGQRLQVMVKDIDQAKKRISLSIKAVEGDPWNDITQRYSKGKIISGRIEKKAAFGYFVTIEPGITGLLPKSKFTGFDNPSAIEKLGAGDSITLTIEEIDAAQRRITLGPTGNIDGEDWRQYSEPASAPTTILGDKLKQALAQKQKDK